MSLGDVEFDLDIYKILKKAIQGSFKSQIVPLRKFPAINP
jgi:DNA polymerase-3 subunit epsilon